jgi:small-conductance mechanosensitive channel
VLFSYVEQAGSALRALLTGFTWLLTLLVLDGWATYVLHQFAYTRPWGERSTAWLLDVLQQFALAIAGAVPGLLVAALIFAIARLVSRATQALLQRVERGDAQLSWLDADTAVPTRRLAALGIWLFALAMAYPYLPGANSEAFKGVTVLAGLMLSLGASSVVGQALSGLSLMYSRSIRVGEYVKVGDTEGTVVALGMFTTKIHTGMGEEVSLPNTVIFSQPIRNFSRLVQDGHFMLHTSVTIGYATPWRQVHAMLLEAAQRTPGVAEQPAPYVVQTALSDFYIEYRLCAQSNKNAPSRRVEAMNQLHANVLDVFNENGVQIMSPHYRADPPEPQVVPPERWSPPPAQTPTP